MPIRAPVDPVVSVATGVAVSVTVAAVALHHVDDRLADVRPRRYVAHLVRVGLRQVADLHDHVAELQPGDGRRRRLPVDRWLDLADRRGCSSSRTKKKTAAKIKYGHEEVRAGPRKDRRCALPDRLGPVRAMFVALGDVVSYGFIPAIFT